MSASGANFVNILKKPNSDGMMVSIDTESMNDVGNGIVEFWTKSTFATGQDFLSGPIRAQYWVQLNHIRTDCRKRLSMTINSVFRDRKNKILLADGVRDPKWNIVIPETLKEHIMVVGCSRFYPHQMQ
jgi:hypothetical protein